MPPDAGLPSSAKVWPWADRVPRVNPAGYVFARTARAAARSATVRALEVRNPGEAAGAGAAVLGENVTAVQAAAFELEGGAGACVVAMNRAFAGPVEVELDLGEGRAVAAAAALDASRTKCAGDGEACWTKLPEDADAPAPSWDAPLPVAALAHRVEGRTLRATLPPLSIAFVQVGGGGGRAVDPWC